MHGAGGGETNDETDEAIAEAYDGFLYLILGIFSRGYKGISVPKLTDILQRADSSAGKPWRCGLYSTTKALYRGVSFI